MFSKMVDSDKEPYGRQKTRKQAKFRSRNSFLIGFSQIAILRRDSITFRNRGKYASWLYLETIAMPSATDPFGICQNNYVSALLYRDLANPHPPKKPPMSPPIPVIIGTRVSGLFLNKIRTTIIRMMRITNVANV